MVQLAICFFVNGHMVFFPVFVAIFFFLYNSFVGLGFHFFFFSGKCTGVELPVLFCSWISNLDRAQSRGSALLHTVSTGASWNLDCLVSQGWSYQKAHLLLIQWLILAGIQDLSWSWHSGSLCVVSPWRCFLGTCWLLPTASIRKDKVPVHDIFMTCLEVT